jgi:hypothetical protein
VEGIKAELHKVARFLERAAVEEPASHAGMLGSFVSAAGRQPAYANHTDGPMEHDFPLLHRGTGFGNTHFHHHLPTNGMHDLGPPPRHTLFPRTQHAFGTFDASLGHRSGPQGVGDHHVQNSSFSRSLGNLPKLHFPSFDGENPKLWQSRCEAYFCMYEVDYVTWIAVASMQFVGPAGRWLQSVENQLGYISWESFCALIRERFAKNQHQVLLRQLFHIRQSGSVSSYVDEFSQLVDKLNAYQHMSDPLYYTMKFVDGLRDGIKAVVMIQRPKDFDTAAVLAQLQEEAGEMIKKREPRRWPQNLLSSPSMQSTQA